MDQEHHRRGVASALPLAGASMIIGAVTLGLVVSQSETGTSETLIETGGLESAEPRIDRFTGALVPRTVDYGLHLLGELNCVACHRTEAHVLAHLTIKTPPDLENVGARIHPGYLREFILEPHATKTNITMPQLFREAGERMVDPIVHYLLSKSEEQFEYEPADFSELDEEAGRVLYHEVGCVACHEAFEPPSILRPKLGAEEEDPYADPSGEVKNESDEVIPDFERPNAPLGDLAAKTNVASLTAFLFDPLAIRPSGHMPGMKLTEKEARAIATYLLRDRRPKPAGWAPFEVDPEQAHLGQQFFEFVGCAACHEVGPEDPTLPHQLARPLRALNPNSPAGCLGDATGLGTAKYNLTNEERLALRRSLAHLPMMSRRRVSATRRVDATMAALNCFACHERDGVGGPEKGRREYFITEEAIELVDEARIPPTLTDIGWKAHTDWMRAALTEDATARPYMKTRMPQYGALNVGTLPDLLAEVDREGMPDSEEPEFSEALADAGRRLIGAGGFKCIDCHIFAGNKPPSAPAPDLATAPERVRYSYYRRWISKPSDLHASTRMPTFWPDGVSPFPQILDGDMDAQRDAIWVYLSHGEDAPPPPGLEPDTGFNR